jgi:hypothetical protein
MKEITITLVVNGSQGKPRFPVKGSQGNNYYLGGLIIFLEVVGLPWWSDNFLGGYWPSRKLIYLMVGIFSWHFGKLGVLLVSLTASLQGNHA